MLIALSAVVVVLSSIFWLILSLVLALGEIRSLLYIRGIVGGAAQVNSARQRVCDDLAEKMGVQKPRFVKHPEISSTFLTGIIHPVVVAPDSDLEDMMTSKEVLVHELAHLKRHDHIWNLIANIAIVLLPFQPLVWLLAAAIEETSDHVSDDYVVKMMKDDMAYASQLYDIAKARKLEHARLVAASAVCSMKSVLIRRIERILDTNSNRHLHSRARDVVSVLFLFLCALFVSGFVGIKREILNIRNTIVDHSTELATRMKTQDASLDMSILSALDANMFNSGESPKNEWQSLSGSSPVSGHSELDVNGGPAMTRLDTRRSGAPGASMPIDRILKSKRRPEIDMTGTLDRHGMADDSFLASLTDNLPEETVDMQPTVSEDLTSFMLLNSYNAGSTDQAVMASLEIAVPGDYEYGDLSDPLREKMRDFYRSLKKEKLYPVWSPDAAKIAFTDKNYGVWVVDADGGAPLLVYDNYYRLLYRDMKIHYGEIKTVGFSPDGRELVYRRYSLDLEHGSRVIANDDGEIRRYYVENPLPMLEAVDLETMKYRTLAENASDGAFSPDGRSFAYIGEDLDGPSSLWLLDLETGTRRCIDSVEPSSLCFTTDSASLLVSVELENGSSEIVTVDCATGEIGSVLLNGNVNLCDLSPDGRWLLFAENVTEQVHGDNQVENGALPGLLDMETGLLYALSTDERESVAWGRFSPEGDMLCLNLKDDGNWNIFLQNFTPPVAAKEAMTAEPVEFSLGNATPNPFNMATTIEYSVAKDSMVKLLIYNSLGQKVRTLVSEMTATGKHKVVWDGLDDNGNVVSAGVYLSHLNAGGRTATGKMTLMK